MNVDLPPIDIYVAPANVTTAEDPAAKKFGTIPATPAGATKSDCQALWHHGYVTASLCAQINRAYRLGFNGEEYSAGLLHDLGRILLALADHECLDLAAGGLVGTVVGLGPGKVLLAVIPKGHARLLPRLLTED